MPWDHHVLSFYLVVLRTPVYWYGAPAVPWGHHVLGFYLVILRTPVNWYGAPAVPWGHHVLSFYLVVLRTPVYWYGAPAVPGGHHVLSFYLVVLRTPVYWYGAPAVPWGHYALSWMCSVASWWHAVPPGAHSENPLSSCGWYAGTYHTHRRRQWQYLKAKTGLGYQTNKIYSTIVKSQEKIHNPIWLYYIIPLLIIHCDQIWGNKLSYNHKLASAKTEETGKIWLLTFHIEPILNHWCMPTKCYK